jgi:hypothetical protein
MTKYFCDRCKKPSDYKLEYVSFPDRVSFLKRNEVQRAELCESCVSVLVNIFKNFMKGEYNG